MADLPWQQYQTKPVGVTAMQWTGADRGLVQVFLGDDFVEFTGRERECVRVRGREGDLVAAPGSWLIRDAGGGHDVCPLDWFEDLYEPVDA
jgi:hypothetical protein